MDALDKPEAIFEVLSGDHRFSGFLEAAPDAIVIVDRRGRIVFANAMTETLFGYKKPELLDQALEILVPERFRGLHRRERANYGATPHARPMGTGLELLGLRKDGVEFPVDISLTPLRTTSATFVASSIRDLTEHKRVLNYARSLIEASLDPLVVIDSKGKITDVNEATVRATGIARSELLGTEFSNCFTEPDRARFANRRVLAEGTLTDYALTIRHRDGRLMEVVLNASLYKDPGGRTAGVFAAARDVTERKKAEAAIAEQHARDLERLAELERLQRLTVDRELEMIALKRRIAELEAENRRLRANL